MSRSAYIRVYVFSSPSFNSTESPDSNGRGGAI